MNLTITNQLKIQYVAHNEIYVIPTSCVTPLQCDWIVIVGYFVMPIDDFADDSPPTTGPALLSFPTTMISEPLKYIGK